MVATTLPPISPSLQAAIRQYGLMHGWKNCAKALAFRPVDDTPQFATVAKRRNGSNGRRSRKLPLAYIWFAGEEDRQFGLRGLRYSFYPNGDEMEWAKRAHELDAARFGREIPEPFQYARPTTATILDETDIRLAQYAPRECCSSPMGVMESWGQVKREGTDLKESTPTAVYQCAVNRKHQQEV